MLKVPRGKIRLHLECATRERLPSIPLPKKIYIIYKEKKNKPMPTSWYRKHKFTPVYGCYHEAIDAIEAKICEAATQWMPKNT